MIHSIERRFFLWCLANKELLKLDLGYHQVQEITLSIFFHFVNVPPNYLNLAGSKSFFPTLLIRKDHVQLVGRCMSIDISFGLDLDK
jgi:hypothetical protein